MIDQTIQEQEPQSERGAVMMTKTEKEDARLVAAFDRMTESETLRMGIAAVSERASAIRAAMPVAA